MSLKDVTPRLGVAYDLFGNGKTALKVSLGKYVLGVSHHRQPGGRQHDDDADLERPDVPGRATRAVATSTRTAICSILQPNGECSACLEPQLRHS